MSLNALKVLYTKWRFPSKCLVEHITPFPLINKLVISGRFFGVFDFHFRAGIYSLLVSGYPARVRQKNSQLISINQR